MYRLIKTRATMFALPSKYISIGNFYYKHFPYKYFLSASLELFNEFL